MAENSSKRIIINTLAQYGRTILSMLLALIATRVVLKSLGMEDYGIYSLVAGVVSMLSFLTSSLVTTTQRYLSVSRGKQDKNETRLVFNNSVYLHVITTLIVVVLLEILYFILFNGTLNIPDNKIESAKILYQFVTLILSFTFVTSPFRAVIVAHENIVFISIIETLDAVFKLVIAYVLFFINGDKLLAYGFFLILIQLFNFISLGVYSYIKYEECGKIKLDDFSIEYIKKMLSFAGWTMYNFICNLTRVQGLAIALNKFNGPIINSSYGLGFQVSGALNNVSASLLNAVNPQLMKSEGCGDRQRVLRFAEIESKFAFFLLTFLAIPCLFEMPRLLELWLGEVPPYSVLFCRMVILAAISDLLTVGLGPVIQAVGNIKWFTIVVYSIKLITLPVGLLFLNLHFDLTYLACIYVLFEVISSIARIPFATRIAGLQLDEFVGTVFLKEIVPVLANIGVCVSICLLFDFSYRFILTFAASGLLYIISILLWGLCGDERIIIKTIVKKLYGKYKKS